MRRVVMTMVVAMVMTMIVACGAYGQKAPVRACESLVQLQVAGAKIASARSVAAGEFVPPEHSGMDGAAAFYKKMGAFCRVAVDATPSADSDIKIEVWMPASGWNGKFQGVGNGGFAGDIGYFSLVANVMKGYATAST